MLLRKDRVASRSLEVAELWGVAEVVLRVPQLLLAVAARRSAVVPGPAVARGARQALEALAARLAAVARPVEAGPPAPAAVLAWPGMPE